MQSQKTLRHFTNFKTRKRNQKHPKHTPPKKPHCKHIKAHLHTQFGHQETGGQARSRGGKLRRQPDPQTRKRAYLLILFSQATLGIKVRGWVGWKALFKASLRMCLAGPGAAWAGCYSGAKGHLPASRGHAGHTPPAPLHPPHHHTHHHTHQGASPDLPTPHLPPLPLSGMAA